MAMELDKLSPVRATTAPAASAAVFDLDTYISRYASKTETRLQRLLLVSSKAASRDLAKRAYILAERQMRDTCNTKRYRTVFRAAAASASVGSDTVAGAAIGSRGELKCSPFQNAVTHTRAGKERVTAYCSYLLVLLSFLFSILLYCT